MNKQLLIPNDWLSWPTARSKQIIISIFFAFAYYFTGAIGLLLAIPNTNVSLVWPPSGIALAAGLIYGYNIWPAIFLGSFINNMLGFLVAPDANFFTFLGLSISIGIGSVLQMLAMVKSIEVWIGKDKDFLASPTKVFKFLMIAVLGCLISSTIGTLSLAASDIIPWKNYPRIFLNWWLGDAAGVFVFTPFLWAWLKYPLPLIPPKKIIEASLLILCFIIISILLQYSIPLIYVVIPLMTWAGVRFSHHGATLVVVMTSIIVIWSSLHDSHFYFITEEKEQYLLLFLQSFIGITTTMTLALGAVVQERSEAYESLRDINENLELIVEERTHEIQYTMEQLKAMQEQIIVQQKLASLGILTAGVAHEIKNPLNFIKNFAELSTKQVDKLSAFLEKSKERFTSEELAQTKKIMDTLVFNVSKITQYEKRADGIVKTMSSHAHSDKNLEFVFTDLNSLIQEDIKAAYQAKKAQIPDFDILIENNLNPDLSKIKIIPQEIARVLQNAFNNAFYALQEKKLQGKKNYIPTLTILTDNLDDNHIIMTIKDNGTGISPEKMKKIFTPFFTTKPPGEGTGLGLSLSHDVIVSQHHGKMQIHSKEGEYTEVEIILPKEYKIGEG